MTVDASLELATVNKRSPAHVFHYPYDGQKYKRSLWEFPRPGSHNVKGRVPLSEVATDLSSISTAERTYS